MKYRIDRNDLPYDAMVPDASWLAPYEEEGETTDDTKTGELQADEVHGRGSPFLPEKQVAAARGIVQFTPESNSAKLFMDCLLPN